MKSSGPLPATAVAPAELRELVSRPGPFLTLYLTTAADIDNAEQRSAQRWKTVRAQLGDQGAPDALLARVDELVPGAHLEGQCLTVVIAADGTMHVEHQPEAPKVDVGRWAALPVLGPLVEWHQQSVPYVIALTDRRGADFVAFRRARPDIEVEVRGDDEPLTKSAPGGWSQRRYQQRAENTWDDNAHDVADDLTALVRRIGARLVVVAGDVRAIQLLRSHLGDEIAALLHEVEGGRSPDGSIDAVAEEASRLVATVIASDTRETIEKYREECGQHDRAAEGAAATVDALNEARVGVLLVPGDIDGAETAWFGAEPTPIALSPGPLHALGIEEPQEGTLLDALIRGALASGAGVRITPRAAIPGDGIGALLRW